MNAIQKLVHGIRYSKGVWVIAIEGGPCAGKSTFLQMAIALLEKYNFKVIVVPEVATELMTGGVHPVKDKWKNSVAFQKQVLLAILEKENRFFEAVQDMELGVGKKIVFLCDRGAAGGVAYAGEYDFQALVEGLGIKCPELLDRYHGVIHLVTAAQGAERFYTTENNKTRSESVGEARLLDQRTLAAYKQHQHLVIVDNSTDFPGKIKRALAALERMVGMSADATAKEIEKKYRVLLFREDQLPVGTKSFDITQVYLSIPNKPGIECRVRCKTTDGVSSYYYTEKIPAGTDGVRHESEQQIDSFGYEVYLKKFVDPGCRFITKTRYKFQFGTYICELDVYKDNLKGLVVLEVELSSEEELATFQPPDFLRVVDVTTNKRYSNRALAEFGMPKV